MFDEQKFQEALDRPRLRQPLPQYLDSNRAEPIRVIPEHELQQITRDWFATFERKLAHYRKLGVDISWLMGWTKRYYWSWIARDMSSNHELYAP